MPLLGKEEIRVNNILLDVPPDGEIFYCTYTGEAFDNYDDYFARHIQCQSEVWTCAVTGRTGLTYTDALESESNTQSILSTIPHVIQKSLLHLMTYLNNFSTNVALSILVEYTTMRFFIGEKVHAISNSKVKRVGYIRDVIPPEKTDSSVSIAYGLDPLSYQYEIEFNDDRGHDKEIIPTSRIIRPKATLTREKIRLFLKQHYTPKSSRYDSLSIREESARLFDLDSIKWEDIFKGPTPNFEDDTTIIKAYSRRLADDYEVAQLKSTSGSNKTNDSQLTPSKPITMVQKKSNLLSKQKQRFIKTGDKYTKRESEVTEKKKKKLKEKKIGKLKTAKTKLQKLKRKTTKNKLDSDGQPTSKELKRNKLEERQKIKEARRKFEEDMRAWMDKRDDLLCDDLHPLPSATAFDCALDTELLGDSLFILEFINVFHEYFERFDDSFPCGISLELFAQILNDTDLTGPFGDLLHSLLSTILNSNRSGEDADEEGDLLIHTTNDDFEANNLDEDVLGTNNTNSNFTNQWVATYFGSHEQLAKLKVDPFTLTEILRLYILKARSSDSKYHKLSEQDWGLITLLNIQTVLEISATARIVLFKLLISDLVKVGSIRVKIEESIEDMFRLKTQIRHINASYTKWLREHPVRLRYRKRKQPANNVQSDKADPGQVAEQPENETTQEEREQFKLEKTKREQEMKKSISELKAKIRVLSSFCRPRPLGLDRAFRRYWVFQSVPGLLVEHCIEEIQLRPCLDSPMPLAKPDMTDYMANVKRRKRKMSPKDNDNVPVEEKSSHEKVDQKLLLGNFDRCTGDQTTCAVHGLANIQQRVRWSFYTKEQLDELIDSLNPRGFRENELKTALMFEKQSILRNHLDKLVPSMLNYNFVVALPPEIIDDGIVRKSERIHAQSLEKAHTAVTTRQSTSKHIKIESKYSKMEPIKAHMLALQDQLVALEEKIFDSCFTSFKLEERDDWYYKVMSERTDVTKTISDLTNALATLARSLRPFCLLPPLLVTPDSRSASPSDKENIEQFLPARVARLSDKWLEQLKPAEGLQSGQLSFESSIGISNLSQLFVNLYILDKSINWQLSAMKTANKCRVCRRKANEEMILCDMCNRGYHIYCLNPPIKSLDEVEGDWFCYTCFPRPNCGPRKGASSGIANGIPDKPGENCRTTDDVTSYSDDESVHTFTEDFDSGDYCLRCKKRLFDQYSEVQCKTCNKGFHLKCVNLVRVPRSWICANCECKEREEEENQEDNSDLRRSSRKRKPNVYYDELTDNVDDYYSHNNKTKRYSYEENHSRARMQRVA